MPHPFEFRPGCGRLEFAPELVGADLAWALRSPTQIAQPAQLDPRVQAWLSVARSIISRGARALPSPGVERRIAEICGDVEEFDDGTGSIHFRTVRASGWQRISSSSVRYDGAGRLRSGLCDSDEEKRVAKWLTANLPYEVSSRLVPQRPLESMGFSDRYGQRADFTLEFDGAPPVVIEVDGSQHQCDPVQKQADSARRDAMRGKGLQVVVVPTTETSPDQLLGELRRYIPEGIGGSQPQQIAEIDSDRSLWANYAAVAVFRVQSTVLQALADGVLAANGRWRVAARERDLPVVELAISDLVTLLADLATLWEVDFDPEGFSVDAERDPLAARLASLDIHSDTNKPRDAEGGRPDLSLDLAVLGPALGEFPDEANGAYLIRPVYTKLEGWGGAIPSGLPQKLHCEGPLAEEALERLLQRLFRKKKFLDGQLTLLRLALARQDCIGLLPTGGGKSMCFQMAGLLQPGLVLVIDPLISLMKDQVEELLALGIDGVGAIHSELEPEERERVQASFWKGGYRFLFISPERLQADEFRTTLSQAAVGLSFSYVVIDEAHCVSEWGHDFRPSYLNVARNAKRHCRTDEAGAPVLIATTGTASRQVLLDIMRELRIANHDSVVEPTSFDRKELTFLIRKAPSVNAQLGLLAAVINEIPRRFPTKGFDVRNPLHGGIVFVQNVNWHPRTRSSIAAVVPEMETVLATKVEYYSGTQPKLFHGDRNGWIKYKAETQGGFKRSEFSMLVATSAFGMGINKPNVRWTVHVGIPISLEAFYQEAGRAGRDRQQAICSIIWSPYDLENLDYKFDSAFPGVDEETSETQRVFEEMIAHHLSGTGGIQKVVIPFGSSREQTEKAIYRLGILGIIDDYTVDWKSKIFEVHAQARTADEIRRALQRYGRDFLVNRRETIASRFDELVKNGHKPIPAGIRAVVEQVYADIKARRLAARKTMNEVARDFDGDPFRQELLAYLTKSEFEEQLLRIVKEERNDPEAWQDILDRVHTPLHWRSVLGDCRRLRNDYPDSVALLMLSCIGRIATSGNETDATSDAVSALRSIATRYGVRAAELQAEELLEAIARLDGDTGNGSSALLLAMAREAVISPTALISLCLNEQARRIDATSRPSLIVALGFAVARAASEVPNEVLV